MQVKVFQQGALQTNCIVISKENCCVVVDCAYISADVEYYVTHNNLKVVAILLTHGHFDHCGGVNHLLHVCNCQDAPVYCTLLDEPMCSSAQQNPWGVLVENCRVTRYLDEGILDIEGFVFRVIYTPGHTRGSCVFVCQNYLFSGDTLFCRSIGRTDFDESSITDMLNSLKKLALLKDDYIVIPGHGEITTLLNEKQHNPYLIKILRE